MQLEQIVNLMLLVAGNTVESGKRNARTTTLKVTLASLERNELRSLGRRPCSRIEVEK